LRTSFFCQAKLSSSFCDQKEPKKLCDNSFSLAYIPLSVLYANLPTLPHDRAPSKLRAMNPSRPLAGILFTLLGGLVFSASNATAKYLAATYPAGQTLFLRSLVAGAFVAPGRFARDVVGRQAGSARAALHRLGR